MGFFGKKKKGPSREVWRNERGEIACTGEYCPDGCMETCPIHMHTLAMALLRIGQPEKAASLYRKALDIAPDFYDAWNNLGMIYGGMGSYRKAHDHYARAHTLKPQKPNPVFGLMRSSLDLGQYEECISWCDLYQTLSFDGQDRPIRDEANKRLGRAVPLTKETLIRTCSHY